MKNYIIIDSDIIQKRIEELEGYKDEPETTQLKIYKEILSQSIPLRPEIKKAIRHGMSLRLTKPVWVLVDLEDLQTEI